MCCLELEQDLVEKFNSIW